MISLFADVLRRAGAAERVVRLNALVQLNVLAQLNTLCGNVVVQEACDAARAAALTRVQGRTALTGP